MKIQKQLLLRLKKFGLNPMEWKIALRSGKGLLTHIQEGEFQLEGEVVCIDSKMEWLKLQVISPGF